MRRPKLFNAGCSIADRTHTTHCYGDYLAQLMNYDYVHLAGGGGSNPRSIRQIVQAVTSGEATSDDMIVVQFTDVTRKEMNSAYLSNTDHGDRLANEHVDNCRISFDRYSALLREGTSEKLQTPNIDITPAGVYTRFKNNSDTYQLAKADEVLHSAYFENAYDQLLDLQNFVVQFRMLDAFLQHHSIPYVYHWEATGGSILIDFATHYPDEAPLMGESGSSKHHCWLQDYWPAHRTALYEQEWTQYHLVPHEDYIHYSILGHKTIANHLYAHIKKYYDK